MERLPSTRQIVPGVIALCAVIVLVAAAPQPGQQRLQGTKAALARAELDSSIGWVPPIPDRRISTPYGERGPWWTWKGYHTGDDYSAPEGTPIFASGNGEVVLAGWINSSYGNGVIISHGNDIQTLYCHLSDVHATTGQRIEMGDRLGLVGATGNVTGPHLHFEMRYHNEPFRPFKATHGGPRGDVVHLGTRAEILS